MPTAVDAGLAGHSDSSRSLLALSLIVSGLLALATAFGLMVLRRPSGIHRF